MGDQLSHIDKQGNAAMVDVGDKPVTSREAIAVGSISMKPATLRLVKSGNAKKGDVIGTARIGGIMAAKRTHELIPLCHPIGLTSVKIEIEPDDQLPGFRVRAITKVSGKTGVEMEALTAVSIACLTIYDMAKAVDRSMKIGDIYLEKKTGGKSGTWTRTSPEAS